MKSGPSDFPPDRGQVHALLEEKADLYNRRSFIEDDPISIPHRFSKKQDIEIAGLFAAVLAWGQRKTIINKCEQLFDMMGNEPHRFVLEHSEEDLRPFLSFKHRTFNDIDTLYFIEWLRCHYAVHETLEDAFLVADGDSQIERALTRFYELFFSLDNHPARTRKHVPTPARKSACKRMNMYLRWMVRKDDRGVDFGLWDRLSMDQLICPCDLHVDRVARRLGLIRRKQTDWLTALELTEALREFDREDPVKYDFALFGLGIVEHF